MNRKMTAEEFLARFGGGSGIELVDGAVVRKTPTGIRKGEVCATASFLLGVFIKSRELGHCMSNDTFVVTGTHSVRATHFCYLSFSRRPKELDLDDGPCPTPDLVLEVCSADESRQELTKEMCEYLQVGVAAVVYLLIEEMTAVVYRRGSLPVAFRESDALTLPDVLPGFSVPVSAFFE